MSTDSAQKGGKVVPFGKYKGQPVEVLAADPSYCEWLTAQAGFRDRYEDIYLLIVNHFHQPEETPAHNAMVGAFLRDGFVRALIRSFAAKSFDLSDDVGFTSFKLPRFESSGWDVVFEGTWESAECVPTFAGEISEGRPYSKITRAILQPNLCETQPEMEDRIDQFERGLPVERFVDGQCVGIFHPTAADIVSFRDGVRCFLANRHRQGPRVIPAWPEVWVGYEHPEHLVRPRDTIGPRMFWVECKPALSDDFPAVLRQIHARMDDWGYHTWDTAILLVGDYSGRGVPKEDMVEIFRRSGIAVVFSDDVAALIGLSGDSSAAD